MFSALSSLLWGKVPHILHPAPVRMTFTRRCEVGQLPLDFRLLLASLRCRQGLAIKKAAILPILISTFAESFMSSTIVYLPKAQGAERNALS